MTTQIHAVRFTADKKLLAHVEEKLQKLKTYHDSILEVEVYLKLDNVVHQIKDKIAEIRVHIPKNTLFVKHESKTFEESFDTAFKSLVNKIKHTKEKAQSKNSSIEVIEESPE